MKNFLYILAFFNFIPVHAANEYILGGAIGKYGIETGLFSVVNGITELIAVEKHSADISDFTNYIAGVCAHFSAKYTVQISRACFGVSGNTRVSKDYIQSPHLPYAIDGKEIAARCNLRQVLVINDFEIMGYGVNGLAAKKLSMLQAGVPREHACQLIIGAGGGLGSSLMVWDPSRGCYRVLPLGACFTDFTPLNEMELDFADFIRRRASKNGGNASWGHVLGSKGGIGAVYEFIYGDAAPFADSHDIFKNRFDDTHCQASVDFYMKLYTQLIRNVIFFTMPYGGVYIVNRVALENPELFEDQVFLQELKNCNSETLNKMIVEFPVYLVKDARISIYGAAYYLVAEG